MVLPIACRVPRLMCLCAAMVVFPVAPQPARAASLREAMQELALDTAGYLKAKDEDGVAVRGFAGPSGVSTSRRLERQFQQALSDRRVRRVRRGLAVLGTFHAEEETGVIHIRLTMVDRNNRPIEEFNSLEVTRTVDDPDDVSLILGATCSSLAEKGAAARLATAVVQPSFASHNALGSIIAADAQSPYRVEMMVRPAGQNEFRSCRLMNREGQAYAPLAADDEYAVRLYNDSDSDCAVRLAIDGLQCFEFSDDSKAKSAGRWLVAGKSMLFLRGWHRTGKVSEPFRIDGLPGSAGGTGLRATEDVGTVTALFYAAWSAGDAVPPIEPAASRCAKAIRLPTIRRTLLSSRREMTRYGVATVEIHSERFEPTERFVGTTIQSAVSIRYDRPEGNAEVGIAPAKPDAADAESEAATALSAEPEC